MEEFTEVPGDELKALGVIDVMRTPADGVNRTVWIAWNTARLAVAAGFEKLESGETVPAHAIVVKNAGGADHSIHFGAEESEDGTI